jgi:uncharacterized protein (TIGR03790 family)
VSVRVLPALSLTIAACTLASSASAQSAANVAVIINDASPASQQIGAHYVRARAIPDTNVFRVKTTTDDAIDRERYQSEIETPLADGLRRANLQDQILYVVLTKGIPLRVEGASGPEGTVASVDSELTLLYRRMTGREVPARGRLANPYFRGTADIASATPFTRRNYDIYLVTRLDAFTAEEAIALIDRGLNPSRDGRFVLDQRGGILSNPIGDRWLQEAHKRLLDLGHGDRVVLESTTSPARDLENVLGYHSWGSNDVENRVRRTTMRFVPGAVAALFVSTDARTFKEPPPEWKPTGDWDDRSTWFSGSPQSLVGDLIREGVTGVAGHVSEPFLQSTIRPEVLFPAYVSGFNLAESFYMAMPDLSWQTVVIGDPLCIVSTRVRVGDGDFDSSIDKETELPLHFSSRREAVMSATLKGVSSRAVRLYLKAEARFNRGDETGRRTALEEATTVAPDLAPAQLMLAMIYDAAGDFTQARQRYEQVIKLQPRNVVALNNLAYNLATHAKSLDRAVEVARRAVLLSPQDPMVIDTIAWIEHLRGDSLSAAKRFSAIGTRETVTSEVHLHAAIVFAAVGDLPSAATQLQLALKKNPALAANQDVQALQARVKR